MTFLTPGRVTNYPRIILVVTWAAIALNILAGRGWLGAGSS